MSDTPFAPTQHWRLKRDGDKSVWLREQLALECIRQPASTHKTSRWLDFARARKTDAPQPAYGFRMTFREPVSTPFSIGYASHFGLGTFIADRAR